MRCDSVSLKERKVATWSTFAGVDYSKSPMDVKRQRSPYSRNAMLENGMVQKRWGWREAFLPSRVLSTYWTLQTSIYDVISISGYLIVASVSNDDYAFHLLNEKYELVHSVTLEHTVWGIHRIGDELVVYTSQGHYSMRVGYDNTRTTTDKHVIEKAELTPYVPLTTTNINSLGDAKTNGRSDATIEQINLLTRWRENGLIGGDTGSEYFLDGIPSRSHKVTFRTNVLKSDGTNEEKTVTCHWGENEYENKLIPDDQSSSHLAVWNTTRKCLVMNMDTTPPIEGESNVYVRYYAEGDVTNDFLMSGISCVFGEHANVRRLFLAWENAVYFSGMDDFTYFPAYSRTEIGTSPITGFEQLSDNVMCVFKEDTGSDATIYYMYADTTSTEPMFPATRGTVGEELASWKACANLYNDVLFLSRTGVYALVGGSNLSSTDKYARIRSTKVSPYIMNVDTSGACAVVYKGKYILSLPSVKECLVAESAKKFTESGMNTDAKYEYEWYHWSNVDAVKFLIYRGRLMFLSSDGKVREFDDTRTDRRETTLVEGTMTLEGGRFQTAIDAEDGDTIGFDMGVYAKLADVTPKGTYYEVAEDDLPLFYEGQDVRIGTTDTKVTQVDRANLKLYVQAYVSGTTMKQPISMAYVADAKAEDEGYSFRLADSFGNMYTDISVDDYPGGTYRAERAIVFEWYMPLTNLDSPMTLKCMEKVTATSNPGIPGNMRIGWETRMHYGSTEISTARPFAFDDLDFTDMRMDDFATSVTRRVRERNFNYIQLRIIGDTKRNCSPNGVSIEYKYNKENRGIN